MKKIVFTAVLLLAAGNASAGWYRVTNYVGRIGKNPVHFSIQRFDFGPGNTVEGSYYYDKHMSPIPVYGVESHDKGLILCEVHTPKEYDKALVQGFRNTTYAERCPFHLASTGDKLVGEWRDSTHSYPVSLRQVGKFDNTGKARISDTVQIPFWGQTPNYAFAGIYRAASANVEIHVINKKNGTVIQTLIPPPDCEFGYFMTPIYMNLESSITRNKIYLNCRSNRYDKLVYYSFEKAAGKFMLSPSNRDPTSQYSGRATRAADSGC